MLPLLLILLFCILGVLTGVLSGILPGLHVNNIALILLSLSGVIVSSFSFLFAYGISVDFILLLICVYITATSISHTFHDFLPSTFLGAPDEDKALSVLPAHALLLEGKGYEAVYLSAVGSYGAILFCIIIAYPVRFLFGSPIYFYDTLRGIMFFVLLAVCILMIGTEKAEIQVFGSGRKVSALIGMVFASLVFLISGVFGLLIFDLSVESPIGLESPVLFPALAGLFGTPTLLTSIMTKPVIPKQNIQEPSFTNDFKKSSLYSVVTGSLAGIFVSIIPGTTSATGTIIAMNTRGISDKKQTIISLSAVNTACAVLNIIVMFIILRSRSGATLAIIDLISIEEWSSFLMPSNLAYLLIAILFSGTLSYFLLLKLGKIFAKKFANVPYVLLIKLTIGLVVILVFLFTGFMGLIILGVSTCIGLLPVEWGVRRSHCMGILLIPIILYFL